jgi:hypothetical protein
MRTYPGLVVPCDDGSEVEEVVPCDDGFEVEDCTAVTWPVLAGPGDSSCTIA